MSQIVHMAEARVSAEDSLAAASEAAGELAMRYVLGGQTDGERAESALRRLRRERKALNELSARVTVAIGRIEQLLEMGGLQ